MAAWMLVSWFHHTKQNWHIFIHDDGTLPPEAFAKLKRLFPTITLIELSRADAEMAKVLSPYPNCAKYRASHPLAQRVFDFAHFTTGSQYVVLDCDVLFFHKPIEILDWASQPSNECWFNADAVERSLVPATEAAEKFSVKLWPTVNTGIGLIAREAIDFAFCERCLAETGILQGPLEQIEQTLFALCASRHGRGRLLPLSYEVTLRQHRTQKSISRHYVGAVRQRFFGEGLHRLHEKLMARQR